MEPFKPAYEVHCSTAVAEAFKLLQKAASLEGRGQAVLRAFAKIIAALEIGPLEFGEPEYRLPALKMEIRSGGKWPLIVHFGVCDERPLVFIKKVILMSRNNG